jgi:hypothetical protein
MGTPPSVVIWSPLRGGGFVGIAITGRTGRTGDKAMVVPLRPGIASG